MFWLEGVLATATGKTPNAREIETRLGAGSTAYAIDRVTLAALYAANRELPTIKVKRELWSRLLMSALGSQFSDSDELFIKHTLLVNTAEIIAHAVLGLSPTELSAASLLSGEKFSESGVRGVVEADFFDWVIEVEEGDQFVCAYDCIPRTDEVRERPSQGFSQRGAWEPCHAAVWRQSACHPTRVCTITVASRRRTSAWRSTGGDLSCATA